MAEAAQAVTRVVGALLSEPEGSHQGPRVSRADPCVDLQGWIPAPADLDRFVSRANYRGIHLLADAFSGFSFGKGDIVGRLYDKTSTYVEELPGPVAL